MSDKEGSGSPADDRERRAPEKNWFTNQVAPLDENLVRNTGNRAKSPFPEGFEDRYFTRAGRNEVTVYADSRGDKELFRDTGDRLKTKESSELAVKAMIETAQHREWQSIKVRGSNEFKREVWLEGQARGMTIKGYRPNELDIQEMKNRELRFLSNGISRHRPTSVKTDRAAREQGETRSRIPTRDPKEREKRELVEAIIERDLRKQFPHDPHQITENMERARKSLDERDARGEKLPSLKVREVREFEVIKDQPLQSVSMDQIKQNVKRQQRDKDMEKVR